jgi:hypothetical protein
MELVVNALIVREYHQMGYSVSNKIVQMALYSSQMVNVHNALNILDLKGETQVLSATAELFAVLIHAMPIVLLLKMVLVIDVQLGLTYHQIEEDVSSKFHVLQGSTEIKVQVFVSVANHILSYPKIKLDVFKRLVLVT